MTAFTVALLYIGSLLPIEQLGIIALSSLLGIAAVIEAGIGAGVFVFIGSSILGAVVVQFRPMIHFYVLFFGYYPIVKSFAEKLKNDILKWTVKLAVFNAALSALWFGFSSLIFIPAILKLGVALVYILGNIAFIAYDIGVSRLISFYIMRVSKHIKKTDR
jgi:hypothetical protein